MDNKRMNEVSQRVLKELNVNNPELLGKGGEGFVFTYTDDAAIKIYDHADEKYLRSLEKLQKFIASKRLSFATPQILEIGKLDSTYYTIEKRLTGVLMEQKFPTVTEKEKYKMLKSYYEAIKALNSIEFTNSPYGNILEIPHAIRDATWQGFLIKMLNYKIDTQKERLAIDIFNFDKKIQQFTEIIKKDLFTDKKSLVHADYFVNQVLVNEGNEISSVMDISTHAVVGDSRLDMAGIFFFDGMKDYTDEHIKFLTDLSVQDYGESVIKTNDIYKLYYCFYFSDVHTFMPEWYQSIIKNLNDERIWERIRHS